MAKKEQKSYGQSLSCDCWLNLSSALKEWDLTREPQDSHSERTATAAFRQHPGRKKLSCTAHIFVPAREYLCPVCVPTLSVFLLFVTQRSEFATTLRVICREAKSGLSV